MPYSSTSLVMKGGDININNTWKVAIVGTGPSGCYTAKYLLHDAPKQNSTQHEFQIDMLERLPTPYGLVRHGVAPDHPEVKNVQHDFDQLLSTSPNINLLANVHVGKDVSLQELRKIYDIVVLAYGCESDKRIPSLWNYNNDENGGILSAREFVAWYNGHPEFDWVGTVVQQALGGGGGSNSHNNIVVIGQGNVALDCARILAKTREELDPTDIATRALDVLDNLPVKKRNIVVVGRRGHVQGAFTIKELRELTKLPHAELLVRDDELEFGRSTEASRQELESSRPKTRIDKLLTKAAADTTAKKQSATTKEEEEDQEMHKVHLRFLLNPVRFEFDDEDSNKTLEAVICERTTLTGEAGHQQAIGTGEEERIPAQLALVSIGYKGVAIEGSEEWFDEARGIMKNDHGLVDDSSSSQEGVGVDDNHHQGSLFVSGWLKRGPSGIIGTNIPDARDTVNSILHHIQGRSPKKQQEGDVKDLLELLRERGVPVVDWEAYQKIEAAESSDERKRHREQPREKIDSLDDLLAVALSPNK